VSFARLLIAFLVVSALTGCGKTFDRLTGTPELSPVGSGLSQNASALAENTELMDAEEQDTWIGGPADLFRDRRAHRRGDMITVKVNLNDKANFSNSSTRTRKAQAEGELDFSLGLPIFQSEGKAEGNIGSDSSASGQGSVNRAEKLNLQLTAVVRKVFDNGTLYIEGGQQTLVNSELRDIWIAGLVNPADVDPDNSVEFSRIAEARVRYGGKGQVSDIQKPGFGLQLWDKVNPF
jgi:flagellar L-ring protein precursor FlgH